MFKVSLPAVILAVMGISIPTVCCAAGGNKASFSSGTRGNEVIWTKYFNKQASFEAEFPSDVIDEKKPNARHFHGTIPGKDIDFRVAWTENVPSQPTREAAVKEMKRIQDRIISMQKVTLLSSKELSISGYPAIEFVFMATIDQDFAIYTVRFVRKHNSFYQVLVGHSIRQDITKEKNRFFDSFKLTHPENESEPFVGASTRPQFPRRTGTLSSTR